MPKQIKDRKKQVKCIVKVGFSVMLNIGHSRNQKSKSIEQIKDTKTSKIKYK